MRKNSNLYKIKKIKQILKPALYKQTSPEEVAIKLFNHIYLCKMKGEWHDFVLELKHISPVRLAWTKQAYKKPSKKTYGIRTPYDIFKKCEIEDYEDACNNMIDQMIIMQEISDHDYEQIRKSYNMKLIELIPLQKNPLVYIHDFFIRSAKNHVHMKKIYLTCDRKTFLNKTFDITEYEVHFMHAEFMIQKRLKLQNHLSLCSGHH